MTIRISITVHVQLPKFVVKIWNLIENHRLLKYMPAGNTYMSIPWYYGNPCVLFLHGESIQQFPVPTLVLLQFIICLLIYSANFKNVVIMGPAQLVVPIHPATIFKIDGKGWHSFMSQLYQHSIYSAKKYQLQIAWYICLGFWTIKSTTQTRKKDWLLIKCIVWIAVRIPLPARFYWGKRIPTKKRYDAVVIRWQISIDPGTMFIEMCMDLYI